MTGRQTSGEVANANARSEMKPSSSIARLVMLLLEVQGLGVVLEAETLEEFARVVGERYFELGRKDAAR